MHYIASQNNCMQNIQDYRQVSYSQFQEAMDAALADSKMKDIEIAIKVGLKSAATVKNAFRKDSQIVSDEVMTHIMSVIGLPGFILWTDSNRYYYIK